MDPLIIGCISQKGGVGKSTLTRLLARIYAGAGWDVKIADLNVKQKTSVNWVADRIAAGLEPAIAGEPYGSVKAALRLANHDLVIFDGAPDSHSSTLDIARAANVLVIPTGVTKDDLLPQVNLAHELAGLKIDAAKILFVLNKTLDSEASVRDARTYVERAGYRVAANHLRMMTSYQVAQNQGRAVTETTVKNLNEEADRLAQELVDLVEEMKETH